jgi:phospholipid/cholesterol/gamma-HCH transport system permease protein
MPDSASSTAAPQGVKDEDSLDLELSFSGVGQRVKSGFAEAGNILKFGAQVIRDLPDLRRYSGEVLAQAGRLILSSAIVVWFMEFTAGTMCATEAGYTLKQVGAPIYSAVFNDVCGFREMSVFMFGYIFAAKVGCGLVAEIGSMRIADEVDALEVMGIHSRSYLVGARIVAVLLAIPFLYFVGTVLLFLSAYLVTVVQLKTVSPGGYWALFWLFQSPYDLLATLTKLIVMCASILFVCCYYGYTAYGGPVGVGRNTAKSMAINMVLIHVIAMFGTWVFWGASPHFPIGR